MKLKKIKAAIDDGFQPELVKNAHFEGIFEIPRLDKPKIDFTPCGMTPFSMRKNVLTQNELLIFFELDKKFSEVVKNPKAFVKEFLKFGAITCPDCSLYRDAPLAVQIGNIYKSRAIGYFYQSQGVNVIPLVRWGSRDTYSSDTIPEKIAFTGIPKNSTIIISTYGCIKSKEDKYHLKQDSQSACRHSRLALFLYMEQCPIVFLAII